MFPMQAHMKISLACITRPYIELVWKVGLLGLSPRGITFSPFIRFCWTPLPFLALLPFYTSIHFPFSIYVSVFPCLGVITRHINPYVRMVGKSWRAWYGVWACQALGSKWWCWQLSRLYCSCTEFVLFFRRFVRCWAWDRPRPRSWAFRELHCASSAVGLYRTGLWALNTKWAGTSDFGPHNSYICFIFICLPFTKLHDILFLSNM